MPLSHHLQLKSAARPHIPLQKLVETYEGSHSDVLGVSPSCQDNKSRQCGVFCAPPSCHIVFNADVVSQPIDESMQAFSHASINQQLGKVTMHSRFDFAFLNVDLDLCAHLSQ